MYIIVYVYIYVDSILFLNTLLDAKMMIKNLKYLVKRFQKRIHTQKVSMKLNGCCF